MYDDLTGKKFNRLLVLKRIENRNHRTCWLCKCDCGNEKEVLAQNLKNNGTQSCGCLHIETNKIKCEYSKLKEPGEAGLRILLARYKAGALRRKFEWKLTKEQFKEMTSRNCYYCGLEPKQIVNTYNSNHIGKYIYNGVDRIDNKLGYTLNNSTTCCKMCNKAKMTLSSKEFLDMAFRIYKKHT